MYVCVCTLEQSRESTFVVMNLPGILWGIIVPTGRSSSWERGPGEVGGGGLDSRSGPFLHPTWRWAELCTGAGLCTGVDAQVWGQIFLITAPFPPCPRRMGWLWDCL